MLNSDAEEQEPPLLEDLGIDIEEIKSNLKSVLFFKKFEKRFVTQLDLIGPLLIAFSLASALGMRAKFVFGYIYGFMTIGCFLVYVTINLIIKGKYFTLYDTMSSLGYSLMPIVGLSLVATLVSLK